MATDRGAVWAVILNGCVRQAAVLLQARAWPFAHIPSGVPHALGSPFCRWRHGGTAKGSELPKVTKEAEAELGFVLGSAGTPGEPSSVKLEMGQV